MPLRNADKIFYMANFTRKLPIGNYYLYYLTSKTLVFQRKLFQRQVNSLKTGEKKCFGPVLVQLLELQCVGLEEN